MKKHIRFSIIFWLAALCPCLVLAQTGSSDEKKADILHGKYEFEEAVAIYKKVLEGCTDSLKRVALEKKLIQSENGLSLLEFTFAPNVVARQEYARGNFFLHYPMPQGVEWVSLPKELPVGGNLSDGEFPVMQYSKSAKRIIFSAPDENGSWNLYTSDKLNDTLWSVPVMMNSNISSAGNEIFPVISASGKTLYFSSNGHYGVGGYDLYVAEWDEESNDWGMPQNMGFPYSSPKDDFLFFNTHDGLYSIFASNRNSSADSMVVYVLDYENVPLKKSVTPAEAAKIAQLEMKKAKSATVESKTLENEPENSENSAYTLAVNKVRGLQKKLSEAFEKQAKNRELYNTLKNQDDLRALEKIISEQEIATMTLQNEVNAAVGQLQRLEMEFLTKGMIIPNVEPEQNLQPESAAPQEKQPFKFVVNTLGAAPDINMLKPEPKIDLSFRILAEGAEIVDMADFPQGLVYQIQLFAVSRKATVKSLKGLAPVFERKYSSGKYIYSAGAFRAYNDALSNLSKVKKRGFASAIITAYKDGKAMNLKSARTLEKELANSGVYQVCIEGYDVLPQELLTVIRGITDKDIAKASADGKVRYVIGPFGSEEDAKILATGLKAISDKTIEIEKCGL